MTYKFSTKPQPQGSAASDITLNVHFQQTNLQHYFDFKKMYLGAFDILVYTDKDLEVPELWDESGACMISNSQEVKLRSFTTSIHKVDSMVAYKNDS